MRSLLLLPFLILVACASSNKESKTLHESDLLIAGDLKGSRYSNIYFSGQPGNTDWEKLKEEGFTHVINLRKSKEHKEHTEKQSIEKLGMNYTHLPLDASREMTPSYVGLVTKAIVAHRKKGKTLVHCGSGNRAGYWAGAHFYLDHGYSKEDSMEMARTLGMTSPRLATKLRQFIDKNQK